MIEERDRRAPRADDRRLPRQPRLHHDLLGVDPHGLEERDQQERLVVAVAFAPGQELLRAVRQPPLAAHVVHVADVIGHEVEEGLQARLARGLAGGELGGELAHLGVGLGEAADRLAVPRAEGVPVFERREHQRGNNLAERRREGFVGNVDGPVPDEADDVGGAFVVLVAPVGLAVDDVDVDRAVARRLDHHFVVEDRVRRLAAGVVEAEERRVASAADGPARPRTERHLDHVAGRELWPADAGARVVAGLLDRKGGAAVFAMHARPHDLREVALGGHVLVELFFGARRDHDLARVVHQLGDAAVGMHHHRAQPVELTIGHVRRLGPGRDALPPRQDRRRGHQVLLVVVRFVGGTRRAVCRGRADAQRQLGAIAHLARVEFAGAAQLDRSRLVALGRRSGGAGLLRETRPHRRAVRSPAGQLLEHGPCLVVRSRARHGLRHGERLVRVANAAGEGSPSDRDEPRAAQRFGRDHAIVADLSAPREEFAHLGGALRIVGPEVVGEHREQRGRRVRVSSRHGVEARNRAPPQDLRAERAVDLRRQERGLRVGCRVDLRAEDGGDRPVGEAGLDVPLHQAPLDEGVRAGIARGGFASAIEPPAAVGSARRDPGGQREVIGVDGPVGQRSEEAGGARAPQVVGAAQGAQHGDLRA